MPVAPLRKTSNARRQSFQVSQSPDMAEATAGMPDNVETLRPESARLPPRTSSRASSRYGQLLSPGTAVLPRSSGVEDVPPRRFSLMRFRFASDTQLATRYKEDGGVRDPSPTPSDGAPAPVIGFTAPPSDSLSPHKKSKRKFKPLFTSRSSYNSTINNETATSTPPPPANNLLSPDYASTNLSFEDSSRPSASSFQESLMNNERSEQYQQPQPRLPLPRHSESSVPTQSNLQGSKFLRFARRKKKPKSLFPLPVKIEPPDHNGMSQSSNGASPIRALDETPASIYSQGTGTNGANSSQPRLPSSPNAPVLAPSAVDLSKASPSLMRQHSSTSARSARSTPANVHSLGRNGRARSGTLTSFTGQPEDGGTPTTHQESGRNSMASTTIGRNSIAGIRSLTSRFRQHSDVNSRSHGSPGSGALGNSLISSNNNSFAISRETLVVPERQEGETSGKYYSRLEKDFPKRSIAMVFSKTSDDFSHDVLRSLMRTFKFYEEPMDLSLRRFLWEIKLPAESQQIDRVISSFAERYHECNPHIFGSLDEAYFIAYSLIILHSDLFNKNNKNKMQRHEYQRNTGGQGIADEILGYFYDNIHYAQFVGQDEEDEGPDNRSKSSKRKKSRAGAKASSGDSQKNGKLDPYDVILSEKPKLEILRPALREVLSLDDTYDFRGTADRIDMRSAQAAFNRYGVLQVVSARSRPEAFTSPMTTTNPEEAQPGVVNIKVAKAGVLWRKDSKKRKTRGPWQEWGVVLTASQVFFFQDASWARSLVHQYEQHQKQGARGSPVVFRPQLDGFNADLKLPLFKAVALQDSNYKRHKHAFILTRSGTSQDGKENFFEEVLLADNENEMNDWIAKLNYAATFTTTGVAMRATEGTGKAAKEKENALNSSGAVESSNSGGLQVPLLSGREIGHQLAKEISLARKDTVAQRLASLEETTKTELGKLDSHMKVARQLEILAPFPQKTRSDLLSFGARLSLTIKWCRFEIWRLKCHRDILAHDLQEQEQGPGVNDNVPSSPVTTSKPSALGRLNSKASAILYAQRSTKTTKAANSRLSASSFGNTSKESDIAGGIDKAFATPTDTLSKLTTPVEGPFRLPPLSLGSGAFDGNADAASSTANPSIRASSVSSLHSEKALSNADGITEDSELPATPTKQRQDDLNVLDDKLSSGVDSDKEQSSALGSPERKSKVRRSLHKTLRDSREMHMPQHQRSRRAEDPTSSMNADDSTLNEDGTRISRGTGSFTVHGKKASVITLGSEWQQISAEERLRLRKQSQNRNSKDSSVATATQAVEDDTNDNRDFATAVNGEEVDGLLNPTLPETDTEGSISRESATNESLSEGRGSDPDEAMPTPRKNGDLNPSSRDDQGLAHV